MSPRTRRTRTPSSSRTPARCSIACGTTGRRRGWASRTGGPPPLQALTAERAGRPTAGHESPPQQPANLAAQQLEPRGRGVAADIVAESVVDGATSLSVHRPDESMVPPLVAML